LATWLKSDLTNRNLRPRDYVLLVRQKAEQYESQFEGAIGSVGLRIRNEAKEVGKTTLQDLLVEDVACVASSLIRLGVQSRAPEAWHVVTDAMNRFRDVASDEGRRARRVADELGRFIAKARAYQRRHAPARTSASQLADMIVTFLDLGAFRRTYRSYASGDSL